MRKYVAAGIVAMAALSVVSMVRADDEKKTIKEVMAEAHKGGNNSLLAKVASGKAGKDEAEKLLALYKDMAANTPTKGDAAAWKAKTEAIVKATELVIKGEKGAGAKLRTATNCAACHKDHK